MKGVILAGGSGTRLLPSTKVTNKHLLPVYNKPMIYYPIETMLKAGITDILILPGKDHAGAFAQLLGSGAEFNAGGLPLERDNRSFSKTVCAAWPVLPLGTLSNNQPKARL